MAQLNDSEILCGIGNALNSYGCGAFYSYEVSVKLYELRNNLSNFYYAEKREWHFNEDYRKIFLRYRIVYNSI